MFSWTGVIYLQRGFRLKEKEGFTGWTVAKPEVACSSQLLVRETFTRLRPMSIDCEVHLHGPTQQVRSP